MKIYTRTGDDGTTGLIGGARTKKDDSLIEALGALDELNAAIGLARVVSTEWPLDLLLGRIQQAVFEIGAEVASPSEHRMSQRAALGPLLEDLERSIDIQEAVLPKLAKFVLPGGCELGARLHFSRTVCRRAERRLVGLGLRPELLAAVNRLSDWLFVAARTANHDSGRPEPTWSKEP